VPVPFVVPQPIYYPDPVFIAPPGSGIANPPGLAAPAAPAAPANPVKRRDPARAAELTTIGDRLFRAGNLPRATERYEQAIKADPQAATPRARLSQIAVRRGHYAEAADRLREAITVDPNWLPRAPDVQALYKEPVEFARELAKIEAHLQGHPGDRDAWLVLGAQWFFSGRTQKAADAFLRLTDRQPDETLAAFLGASKADPK
jgi:tetratricopeptide (TPR) repeat protein